MAALGARDYDVGAVELAEGGRKGLDAHYPPSAQKEVPPIMNPRKLLASAVVASVALLGIASPAHAVGRLSIQDAYTSMYLTMFASANYGVGNEATADAVAAYQWYTCEGDTDFLSTRISSETVNPSDVTEADIATELSANACVEVSGAVASDANYLGFYEANGSGFDAKGAYATYTLRLTSSSVAYPVYAVADGSRLHEVSSLPTAEKSDPNFVGAGAVTTTRTEITYRLIPDVSSWYVCDHAVTAGMAQPDWTINVTPTANTGIDGCRELITDFYDDEGLDAHFAEDPTINPTGTLYDTWPSALGLETPANLDGKFLVYVTVARPYLAWSNGLRVGEEQVISTLLKDKVYFDSSSAKLTSQARAKLKAVAKKIKSFSSVSSIVVMGFVQPSPSKANDLSLSKARAVAVRKALKSYGVTADITVSAKGRLDVNSPLSRKAVITVKGTVA